jgi:hypothetical protein
MLGTRSQIGTLERMTVLDSGSYALNPKTPAFSEIIFLF